jgi:hypothetical protein
MKEELTINPPFLLLYSDPRIPRESAANSCLINHSFQASFQHFHHAPHVKFVLPRKQ